VAVAIDTDFDSNGVFDLTQNYTLNLSAFTAPNGFTGVSYVIVPQQFFGSVIINGTTYGYASVVSNNTGTLFDGSNTQAGIQFQFVATPVPEPSTYALAGVLALGGIVAYRRRRNSSSALVPSAQALMA
jgi:MYXO-CTERM domain-containing protein